MLVTTTKCKQFGHREFVLESDESQVPETYLHDIVATVESMVAEGSVFAPDETFQIGCGVTLVKDAGEMLTLVEPDMASLPIQWVTGITQTLRQMMVQIFMLDSVGMRDKMDFPSIRHSLITCTQFGDANFVMSRNQASHESDSGWFVGCCDRNHDHNSADNLQTISVYEAFVHQPGIQGFAAFPIGSFIALPPGLEPKIFFEDSELEVKPGSFFDEWSKRRKDADG